MEISVDVDCVVADFVTHACNTLGDPDNSKATYWDWFETTRNYKQERIDFFKKMLLDHNWWMNLPLIEGSQKGVEYLRRQGHNLIWTTAPYKKCKSFEYWRRVWLEKHFKVRKNKEPVCFVPSEAKKYMSTLVFIDDKVSTVEAWQNKHKHGLGLVYKSSINQSDDVPKVTWEEIMEMQCFKRKKHIYNKTAK